MKKGVIGIFLVMLVLLAFVSFAVADSDNSGSGSDDDSNSGSDSERENDSDDGNNLNVESELEVETDDSGTEIKYKEKSEVEYSNGTKYRYEYELRERHELSEDEERAIIRERNRLRVDSEIPEGCEQEGVVLKCEFENGSRILRIQAGNSNNTIIQVKNVNASTQVQLYKSDDGKVYAQFRNNETKEIILPDEVQARIESQLRERIHLNATNITLDEEGEYQIEARKRARLLWIIPIEEIVQAQVDAETGEVIQTRTSWWGFLAHDVRSE